MHAGTSVRASLNTMAKYFTTITNPGTIDNSYHQFCKVTNVDRKSTVNMPELAKNIHDKLDATCNNAYNMVLVHIVSILILYVLIQCRYY